MRRCAAECTYDLNDEAFMDCSRCKDSYHYLCVNLTREEVESLTPKEKKCWLCPRCLSKQPKGGNMNLPVRSSTPPFNVTRRKVQQKGETSQSQSSTIASEPVTRLELRDLIREEMRSAVEECMKKMQYTIDEKLGELRENINSFRDTISYISDQFDNMQKNYEECRTGVKELRKENELLRSELNKQSLKLFQIDQLSRASNLEILCVPENKSENVVSILQQLCRVVKCNINENDIQYCARTAKMNPSSTRPRSILVKMNSPRTRDSLLAAVVAHNKTRPQDKLNTSDLGFGVDKAAVYVVENLSPENKALHAAARLRGKQLQYKFVWVRGGRIYMKKTESSEVVLVRSREVLDTIR